MVGSPWWGEVNMATSPLPSRGPHGGEKSTWKGVDVVEMSKKWVKMGEIQLYQCERGIKIPVFKPPLVS